MFTEIIAMSLTWNCFDHRLVIWYWLSIIRKLDANCSLY